MRKFRIPYIPRSLLLSTTILNDNVQHLNYSLFKFFKDAFVYIITEIFNSVFSIGQYHGSGVVR